MKGFKFELGAKHSDLNFVSLLNVFLTPDLNLNPQEFKLVNFNLGEFGKKIKSECSAPWLKSRTNLKWLSLGFSLGFKSIWIKQFQVNPYLDRLNLNPLIPTSNQFFPGLG